LCTILPVNSNSAEYISLKFIIKDFCNKTCRLKVVVMWENVIRCVIRRNVYFLFM